MATRDNAPRFGALVARVASHAAAPVGGILPRGTLSELRFELAALRARVTSVACRPDLGAPPYRLEIGSSQRRCEGFIGVDMQRGSQVVADVRWRIPLPDGSCEGIFCEHVLEHLRFREEAPRMLGECLRLLAPGSPMRISVPDARKYLSAYLEGDTSKLASLHPWGNSAMTTVNWVFHGYGHKFGWDAETLVEVMREAGFEKVEERTYGNSAFPWLVLDRPERAEESLYVEGCAPWHTLVGAAGHTT